MKLLTLAAFLLAFALPQAAKASGSYAIVSSPVVIGPQQTGRRIRVSWKADSATASIPTATLQLNGLVAKVVTDPGSTAPTDNYDIACGDPLDTNLDVFGGALANRDTANTEQVYPVASGATMPVYAASCTLAITGNAVNSATGVVDFYVLNP